MFELYLYNNKAENNRVDKTTFITLLDVLYGTLREECSAISPSILIESVDPVNIVVDDLRPNSESGSVEYVVDGSDTLIITDTIAINIMKSNYAYIPQFNRYYYIDNIVSVRTGLWRLDMSCDVLMSFKDKILDLDAYIGRQEFKYDKFLFDDKKPLLPLYNLQKIDGYSYFKDYSTNDIDDYTDFTYILITFGNAGSLAFTPSALSSDNMFIYVVNGDTLKYLLQLVYTVSGEGTSSDVNLKFTELSQVIYKIVKIPIDLRDVYIGYGDVSYQRVTQFQFGNKLLDISDYLGRYGYGMLVSNYKPIKINAFRYGIRLDDILELDKIFSNLTKCRLYLPYAGFVDLDLSRYIDNISNDIRIDCYYYYDIFGDSKVFIYNKYMNDMITNNSVWANDHLVDIIDLDFGCDLPVVTSNVLQSEISKQIAYANYSGKSQRNLLPTIVSGVTALGGLMSGNVPMALSGLGSVIGNGINTLVNERENYMQFTANSAKANLVDFNIGFNPSNYLGFSLGNKTILLIYTLKTNLKDDEYSKYRHIMGSPCSYFSKLSSLNGYTEVYSIHLENIENATSQELSVIESHLRSGVLLPDKTE